MGSRIKTDVKKLFEFWCEVAPTPGLERGTNNRGGGPAAPPGVILESFPEGFRDKEVLTGIPSFAYPCDLSFTEVLKYSFVHTTGDSKWRFGFCIHVPKTKTAMVLITYLPWHDTFLQLLQVLSDLKRNNPSEFRAFLAEAYSQGVPESGGNLKVFYNGGQSQFEFVRPQQFQLPNILKNNNLNMYYSFVKPKEMIEVFAAMLAERRIVFTSRHLDRLSACIQAANAFLYPMVWQHIFIPVLPWEFKDYLGAPMPYLIGVPKPVLEAVSPEELGEVVILNCDNEILESPFDDVHSLPSEIVSQMKKQLNNKQDHQGDGVSKIFLNALVQLIGGYRDAVEYHETSKTFNPKKFIESRPAHLRPFLAKMMELQIFAQFIDDRLKMLNSGLGFSDEFELETVRYAEKKKRGRNYALMKSLKDKTNPAYKSAVKSVKEGSKGMKTAYKGLKTKLRENGNQFGGTHFHFGLGSPNHSDRPDGGYVRGGKAIGATHHSAPSSPVTSKRLDGLGSGVSTNGSCSSSGGRDSRDGSFQRRGPVPLAMSSSSSHIQPNGYGYGQVAGASYGHHLSASSAVSSASSLCSSSEMNLSQELQNHPLFKTPAVDRSLKPSSEHRRGGAPPARPPPPQTAPASYYNHPYSPNSTHPIVETKPPRHTSTPTRARPVLPTADSNSFDSPPDMQSPPIPPRKQCSVVAATAAAISAEISKLERNCWQDESPENGFVRHSNASSSSAMSSSSSGASFVTAASTFSHLNVSDPPVPTPRTKREQQQQHHHPQQQQPLEDSMNDLISLDDSNNTSFDLEDFDPLNQNARPLPPLGKAFGKKSSTLPAGVNSSIVNTGSAGGVNNPLYPYFAPKHMATVAAVTGRPPPLPSMVPPQIQLQRNTIAGKPDDDFELLRKYGLDQFTLNNSATEKQQHLTTGKGMTNWTTFD
ncbi:DENN domain-containing protein 1C isoform X1 [Drosophila bipectinata]|uniref:DENN domain-containing protein 1C isoform X1 n=2 Tax=Drosophila bipectinata TaxID=42026 RepID=UPI001C89A3B7|nr:DENN domain-containing protein 1C isoform X1 [Drosophila bipectinata]